MADSRSCDTTGCNRRDARRVEAAVAIYDLIPGSPATGHSEGVDACDDHYATTARALLDFSLAAVLEDAPALAESLIHAAERDAATHELDEMRPVFAELLRADKEAPKDVRDRYEDLAERQSKAEQARVSALRTQTKLADVRTAKLAKVFKKR